MDNPPLAVVLTAAAFRIAGYSTGSSIFLALLIVCPVIIIYGIAISRRAARDKYGAPHPMTKGVILNRIAPYYDRYCGAVGLGSAFRERTMALSGIMPGEKVLDVGCGTGVLTRYAARAVGKDGAEGIDPAPLMIEVARKGASREGSTARFRIAVIEDLPFGDSSFDCVLSSLMIHHLPPDVKIKGLKEVLRVLKPGGRLLAVDIDRPTNPLWWTIAWPLLFWSCTRDHVSGRLGGYFRESGFRNVERLGGWLGIIGFYRAVK